ncbi:MAG: hypothetical protein JRI68_27750 [Deltaproteobacteria bacterium]|nr:hypothetical protein [Deltaproteobacteria bacterium]
MTTPTMRRVAAGTGLSLLLLASSASAISRDEVMVRAKAFAFHPWTCTSANLTASCDGGYHSVYVTGDYMGLPYDWGGYMTKFQFDQQIASGHGAGSYPDDGVLSCTSGLDCSGFVSKAWGVGHFTTSSLHQTSSSISQSAMLPGDAFNESGYHVTLYSHTLGNGDPVMYEAVGYNTHLSMPGWSWVNGYVPRRLNGITGTTAVDPPGSPENPIVIGSFPYTHSGNTLQSKSDVLDGCGASPDKNESGPEVIYEVNFSGPGTVTLSVQDDSNADIDVHLYTSMNTSDCVARHDNALSYPVDCGKYYVVADTFKGSTEYPGAYTLTVDFSPTGGGCGNGPPKYDFVGGLGDPCAYPSNPNLPFCNPNLDAQTCLYGSSTSFCSKPCASAADCGAFPGGCCEDIGNQEFYCLTADMCGGGGGGVDPGDGGSGPGPGGDPGSGGSDPSSSSGSSSGLGGGTSDGDGWTASFADGEDDDTVTMTCAHRPVEPSGKTPVWLLLGALGIAASGRRRRR